PAVRERLSSLGDDYLLKEQYIDYLVNRPFRQSLLCRQGVQADRTPRPERLAELKVVSVIKCQNPEVSLRSPEPMVFHDPSGVEMKVTHPVSKAAMLILSENWPTPIPFADLEQQARARILPDSLLVQTRQAWREDSQVLATNLLKGHLGGTIEFQTIAPSFQRTISERPLVGAWQRRQIRCGGRVTNLRHVEVELSLMNRRLALLLNGQRTKEELIDAWAKDLTTAGVPVLDDEEQQVRSTEEIRSVLAKTLDESLVLLSKIALLEA
ncbi:MAG: methyltransferase regulatory domain-containing protein, partial [Planctomycetales bacterium]